MWSNSNSFTVPGALPDMAVTADQRVSPRLDPWPFRVTVFNA